MKKVEQIVLLYNRSNFVQGLQKNPQILILPVVPQILSANFVRSLPVKRSASPHFTGGLGNACDWLTRKTTWVTWPRLFHILPSLLSVTAKGTGPHRVTGPESKTWLLPRVAVNSTHGQLDTCVEFTHLPKSQLDTSQLDTGVNSTHGQLDTYTST